MEILALRPEIEQLLAARFGGAVRTDGGTVLNERTHVARFQLLEGPPGIPASVIAKGWRSWEGGAFDPQSTDPWSPASLLYNDWAGLQFLTEVMGEASPAPRFYHGDRVAGFFLMEDIASGQDPADTLLGSDPVQARAQLISLASALGRMHAASIGHKPRHDRIRGALGPAPEEDRFAQLVSRWQASLEQLGLAQPLGLGQDLDQVQRSLVDPGPFLAYTHRDPCPDNWRDVGGRMRLFDFETGGFRHALLDGVYGRFHFPTCWCVNRFPPDLPEAMEQAYRSELAVGCPVAGDDRLFYSAVVEMCAFWMLVTCEGRRSLVQLMEEDGRWGIASLRQRVLVRGEIFTALAEKYHHLPRLGEIVADLMILLRSRWPEEAQHMPVYPAFV